MNLSRDYVSIPKRLIYDLRDNQLALALYMLVARLYLIHQQPIPLSRGDIQQLDPSTKVGAIKRALDRLVDNGWLTETSGVKQHYTPNWGQTRDNHPYPWVCGAPVLGCPQYIWSSAVRIDRALLDVFVGKFTPHVRNPLVERYVTTPLLSLREVGGYICAASGFAVEQQIAVELLRWGLLSDGKAQPVPDSTVVLALASQRATPDHGQLTDAAWRKLGWLGTPITPEEPLVEATPLLFVPKHLIGEQIGPQIGPQIGSGTSFQPAFRAPESEEVPLDNQASNMAGIQGNLRYSRDTTPYPHTANGGGDNSPPVEKLPTKQRDVADTQLNTPTAQLLRSLHVYPASIAEFAQMPTEVVERAIVYARSEPMIRGVPNMVITMLRRHRDEGWTIPTVANSAWSSADITAYTNGIHGDLFKRGSDLSGIRVELGRVMPIQATETARTVVELERDLHTRLLLCCSRSDHRLIRGIQMRVIDGVTVLYCASPTDRVKVVTTLMPPLRQAVAELGLPLPIRIADGRPHEVDSPVSAFALPNATNRNVDWNREPLRSNTPLLGPDATVTL